MFPKKVTKISEKILRTKVPFYITHYLEEGTLYFFANQIFLRKKGRSSTDGIIITQQQLLLSAIRYCQTYLQGHPPHMTVTTHVSMFELEGVEVRLKKPNF